MRPRLRSMRIMNAFLLVGHVGGKWQSRERGFVAASTLNTCMHHMSRAALGAPNTPRSRRKWSVGLLLLSNSLNGASLYAFSFLVFLERFR